MATGKYDPETDLIKMDCIKEELKCNQTEIVTQSENWIDQHKRFGHMNKRAMTRSLPTHNRFNLLNEEGNCEDCEITKRRQRNIPRLGKTNIEEPLQILEMDLQGPFKIKCINGSSRNLKIYDKTIFSIYI